MIGDLYQSPLRYGATFEESSGDGVTPRPHWQPLMESLQSIGTEELARRWSLAERRIRENGITYNIYGDPLGMNRPGARTSFRCSFRLQSGSSSKQASYNGLSF